MKLSIEIKDGKFVYDYLIGTSKHSGESHLDEQSLIAFVNATSICYNATCHENKELWDEIAAKAYLERNKDDKKLKEYIDNLYKG